MNLEFELENKCDPRTLRRARNIEAAQRYLLSRTCEYYAAEVEISAAVLSSNNNGFYRTKVTLDDTTGEVYDYECTCPASFSYEGMCKHEAAIVLSFQHSPHAFAGYRPNRVESTSKELAALINKRAAATGKPTIGSEQDASRKPLAASVDCKPGSIELIPRLMYKYETWELQVSIASPRVAYVVKDLDLLLDNFENDVFHSYGKRLAFRHTESLLSEHGKRILAFLRRAQSVRRAMATQASWYWRGTTLARSFVLANHEIAELLVLTQNAGLSIETAYPAKRGNRTVSAPIIDGAPQTSVTITMDEKRPGFQINVAENIIAVQADEPYAFDGAAFYHCPKEFVRALPFLSAIADSDEPQFLAEKDASLFCATVLPDIESAIPVAVPSELEEFRPVPCKIEFRFDCSILGVTCEVIAQYGKVRFSLFAPVERLEDDEDDQTTHFDAEPVRDAYAEDAARSLVCEYLDETGVEFAEALDAYLTSHRSQDAKTRAARLEADHDATLAPFASIHDDETIGPLVFGGLMRFRDMGEVLTTPAFERLLFESEPHITAGLSLAGNLINLEVQSNELDADDLVRLLSSYRQKKRFHRLKSGAYVDLENMQEAQLQQLREVTSVASDLGLSAKALVNGGASLPSYHAFYLQAELAGAFHDKAFTGYLHEFDAARKKRRPVPRVLNKVLRPYQKDGYRWLSLLADCNFGGILADEMGLGKSIQLISFLLAKAEEAREIGPNLIVCPASLVYNWEAEFQRFAPSLKICPIVGNAQERVALRRKPDVDVFVTSYDLLRIDADDFASMKLFSCTLDEAQYIKNHTTKTTRAVKQLQATHRFALTGTPMENRPSEVWSIFDYLMPGLLGSYMRFRERFEIPVLGGDEEAAERLAALIGPFMMRREKKDVLQELPDKLENVVYAPLEGEQRALYAAHEQQLRDHLNEQKKETQANSRHASHKTDNVSRVQVLAELTRLRQICCDPHLLYDNYKGDAAKLGVISDLITQAIEGEQKVLVFSQFTSFLDVIARMLDKQGIAYYTITGSTPKRKRIDLVDAFNSDKTPVFLVSLKAGGTGLNLTGASVVIHADPWWNLAAQNQATDRAHRIGQKRLVSVYQVVAKGTIEERILALQNAKDIMASKIVGAPGTSLASLSADELADLLSSED